MGAFRLVLIVPIKFKFAGTDPEKLLEAKRQMSDTKIERFLDELLSIP